jgi:hypothetical protein
MKNRFHVFNITSEEEIKKFIEQRWEKEIKEDNSSLSFHVLLFVPITHNPNCKNILFSQSNY